MEQIEVIGATTPEGATALTNEWLQKYRDKIHLIDVRVDTCYLGAECGVAYTVTVLYVAKSL